MKFRVSYIPIVLSAVIASSHAISAPAPACASPAVTMPAAACTSHSRDHVIRPADPATTLSYSPAFSSKSPPDHFVPRRQVAQADEDMKQVQCPNARASCRYACYRTWTARCQPRNYVFQFNDSFTCIVGVLMPGQNDPGYDVTCTQALWGCDAKCQ
jgi:hypothetical protein